MPKFFRPKVLRPPKFGFGRSFGRSFGRKFRFLSVSVVHYKNVPLMKTWTNVLLMKTGKNVPLIKYSQSVAFGDYLRSLPAGASLRSVTRPPSLASLAHLPPPLAPLATPTTARPLLEIRSRTVASNSLNWPSVEYRTINGYFRHRPTNFRSVNGRYK